MSEELDRAGIIISEGFQQAVIADFVMLRNSTTRLRRHVTLLYALFFVEAVHRIVLSLSG